GVGNGKRPLSGCSRGDVLDTAMFRAAGQGVTLLRCRVKVLRDGDAPLRCTQAAPRQAWPRPFAPIFGAPLRAERCLETSRRWRTPIFNRARRTPGGAPRRPDGGARGARGSG